LYLGENHFGEISILEKGKRREETRKNEGITKAGKK